MIKTCITNPSAEVIGNYEFANVLLNNASSQKSLHAAIRFAPGDVICTFDAALIQSFATCLTLQTGTGRHITLKPEFLQYVNHSCLPTVFFDTASMELVCLRALEPGDEFTFFYPSTEWEMAQPFICNCGSKDCLQLVKGAAHLAVETLSKYKLTEFIRQQVKQTLCL